ncbi:MAG: Gfo/Idh/MocA family oxidoreductase [Rikenellaceae bacterium]
MKKVRFGIVGTSLIVDKVLKGAFLDERFEFVALYSRKQETGEAFASKYGVQHVFTSLEEMTSSDLIDAVYIASPNSCHAEQAICAMNNKKHVLCEKPFASSADEVRSMIECAKRNGVTLMEAMKSTLTPNFTAIRENLPKIGKVRRYLGTYINYSSRYDNYRAGILENTFMPELTNGAIMDIGVYAVYPMVVLFGKPQSVQSTGTMLESGVDAEGTAIFKYDGFTAVALFSKVCRSEVPTEIQGEDGTIIVDKINTVKNVEFVDRVAKTKVSINRPSAPSEYFYEIEEFINLIEAGKQESDVNSWDISLTVMELVDEIRNNIWENN